MQDAMREIKALEGEIRRIKLMHSLGRISLAESKRELRILDSRLKALMDSLPEKDRNELLFRKEYHSVHY